MGTRPGPPGLVAAVEAAARERIERLFPRLPGTSWRLTSPQTGEYNCIAWAAGDDGAWWEPVPALIGRGGLLGGKYWPKGVPCEPTLDAYIAAFRRQGYRECDSSEIEDGYEKVAIYFRAGVPTHASRQLDDGWWASKLGAWEDIEHETADDIGGSAYGEVAVYMRRKKLENLPHPRMRNISI